DSPNVNVQLGLKLEKFIRNKKTGIYSCNILFMVYVLSVYNKKEKYHRITMAAFNIQEAFIWKEKIEYIICRHQGAQPSNGNKYIYFEYKSGMDNGKTASSSDRESQFSAPEDEDEPHPNLLRRTTIGNGPPESIF
ncbi:hypothetical protein S83_016236, partial [Arachis hypogaea]